MDCIYLSRLFGFQRRVLVFSNGWINRRVADDVRCHDAYCDVIVISWDTIIKLCHVIRPQGSGGRWLLEGCLMDRNYTVSRNYTVLFLSRDVKKQNSVNTYLWLTVSKSKFRKRVLFWMWPHHGKAVKSLCGLCLTNWFVSNKSRGKMVVIFQMTFTNLHRWKPSYLYSSFTEFCSLWQ